MRPGEFFQVAEQGQGLAVHAEFFVQEIELIIRALQLVSAFQGGGAESEIFRLALRGRHVAGGAQFTHPRKIQHQARHHQGHHVLDVHLEGELRVRKRALDCDVLDRGEPIEVSGLNAGLIQHRAGEVIAEAGFRGEGGQRRLLAARPVIGGDRFRLAARFPLAFEDGPGAAGKKQAEPENSEDVAPPHLSGLGHDSRILSYLADAVCDFIMQQFAVVSVVPELH